MSKRNVLGGLLLALVGCVSEPETIPDEERFRTKPIYSTLAYPIVRDTIKYNPDGKSPDYLFYTEEGK